MGMKRLGSILALLLASCCSSPISKPYISYRTSPFDQGDTLDHKIPWDDSSAQRQQHRSQIHEHDAISMDECPLQFSLGISKRVHSGHDGAGDAIRHPPIIHPVFPARGPGRQVVYNTQYEHLDLLSPAPLETSGQAIKEALLQASDFPLLMESSSFLTSPILHDVNGDGITDAILSDYDGGIYIVGLAGSPRYFHHTQVPRLYIRREWLEKRVNETLHPDEKKSEDAEIDSFKGKIDDPYHSYFEYYYAGESQNEKVIRGVTANLLDQEHEQVQGLTQRRSRRVKHDPRAGSEDPSADAASADEGTPPEEQQQEEPQQEEHQQEEHQQEEHQQEEHQQEEHQQEEHQQEEHQQEGQQRRRLQEVSSEGAQDEPVANKPEGLNEAAVELDSQEAPKQDTQGDNVIEEPVEDLDVEQVAQEAPKQDTQGDNIEQVESVEKQEVHEEPKKEEVDVPPVHEQAVNEEIKVDASGQADISAEGADPAGAAEPDESVEGQQVPGSLDEQLVRALENPDKEESEDAKGGEDDNYDDVYTDDPKPSKRMGSGGDDYMGSSGDYDDYATDDPDYARGHGDDYGGYGDYDDMHGHDPRHDEYYDEDNYIRVPPHILCTPVLAELAKLYGDKDEMDDVLFVAVSYYLDEDEYQGFFSYKRFEETDRGDETEVKRGSYVSSAIMAYTLGDSARWSGQTHLDLSTDFSAPENVTVVGAIPIQADLSNMGAFALGSPTVADLDGDGSLEVLLGTSMGIVYAFDARQMYTRKNWPIQMENPVESRIIVEDAVGDTNLEVFISDIGGNVVCFSHEAIRLWHRDLLSSLGESGSRITGSSNMVLGDVNGDGVLDLVVVIRTKVATHDDRAFVFALNAATGEDVPNFPIELSDPVKLKKSSDGLHHKLAQPLLVDLHADQSFLNAYLRRNGTEWKQRTAATRLSVPPHGGSSPGLHIVQPLGEQVYIIEAGSGCTQKVSIGAEVSSMVAVDDVHGTNRLDLVVVTEDGKTITLESASPYHPLNTWNHGEVRGRTNSHAHGYSASQGIFVHEVSRQYIDIFGVYVPITFEVFDNRPNIKNEPDRRKYAVDVRDGTSSKRILWRKEYSQPGVYTERIYIRYGPGYYSLSVVMRTSHGLVYEDTFHIGYNVHFMDGFGSLLVVPLLVAAFTILLCGAKKVSWDDEEFDGEREGNGRGILDQELPS